MARMGERVIKQYLGTMTDERTRSSYAKRSRRAAAGWCGQGIVLRDVAFSSSPIGPERRATYHSPGGQSAVFRGRRVS